MEPFLDRQGREMRFCDVCRKFVDWDADNEREKGRWRHLDCPPPDHAQIARNIIAKDTK